MPNNWSQVGCWMGLACHSCLLHGPGLLGASALWAARGSPQEQVTGRSWLLHCEMLVEASAHKLLPRVSRVPPNPPLFASLEP